MILECGSSVVYTQGKGWTTDDIGRTGHVIFGEVGNMHLENAKSHVWVYLFHVRIHFTHLMTLSD